MLALGLGISLSTASFRASPGVVAPPEPVAIPVSVFDTTAGDGTVNVDSTAQTVSVTYGTTTTAARSSAITVDPTKRYRLHWTQGGDSSGQLGLGSLVGGVHYRPYTGNSLGANSFDFAPNDPNLFITVARSAAGTTTFSGFQLEVIPNVAFVDSSPALMTISNWAATDANTTINTGNSTISIASTGTQVRARATAALVPGTLYRFRYNITGANAFLGIGTAAGGQQYKAFYLSETGQRTFEFTATQETVHFQFHRTASGTAVISDFAIQVVAEPTPASITADSSTTFADNTNITADRG